MSAPGDTFHTQAEVTLILDRAVGGDEEAIRSVWEGLQQDIRAIAGRIMSNESPTPSMQATLLVNEAYIRLFSGNTPNWEDRRHFLNTVALSMSRFLIDRARQKEALRHGGGRRAIPLTVAAGELAHYETASSEKGAEALLAIEKLNEHAPDAAEVARLRFIHGLTVEQTSDVMNIASRTVKLKWKYAKAFIRKHLEEDRDLNG